MNTSTGVICLGLLLASVAPAVCAPLAALVGKWQGVPDSQGHRIIFEFHADGSETRSMRQGKTVTLCRYPNGKPIVVNYAVSGDKMTTTALNRPVEECLFRLQGNTLTILKWITINGRPVRHVPGETLTRLKGWHATGPTLAAADATLRCFSAASQGFPVFSQQGARLSRSVIPRLRLLRRRQEVRSGGLAVSDGLSHSALPLPLPSGVALGGVESG